MGDKKSPEFIIGIIGNLVASFILLIANILAARFLPGSSREWLDIFSILIPLLLLSLFAFRNEIAKLRGSIQKIRRPNLSTIIVLTVTVTLIVSFGLLFRWISEGRVQNMETRSPIIYDTYTRVYDIIKP